MDRRLGRFAAAALAVTLLGACAPGAPDTAGSAAPPPAGASSGAGGGLGGENVDLYDSGVVHSIAVTFDNADYDEVIAAYNADRSKKWMKASVEIDGVKVENVGMRLKGNSSLRALGNRNGAGAAASPQSLPWLVRLDKYVDGQSYQGHTEIVVRGNSTRTSLNEAVALEVIGLAGEPTQKAFATRFSVNGSAQVLRLVIENPNDEWEEAIWDTSGILYKAESTGDYSYRGDDPDAYDEVFDQESDTDKENLAPLIDFLEFINTSSAAEFNAELPERFDVQAFARYLALQDMVGNFDDIDGPGNNSYLRYDEATGKFTILSWDLNLAFGATPGGAGGAGGAGGIAAGAPGAAGAGALRLPPSAGPAAPPGGAMRGGPGGRSNILVQRFQANTEFVALINEARAELTARLFASGQAAAVLDRWADVLKAHAGDLVEADVVDRESATIRARLG